MTKNYNKDIMNWQEFPAYDMIWTDPPWGQRMVKTFETMMKKQTGAIANNSIDGILSKLAILADVNKPVVMEYGEKDYEEAIEIMEEYGHKHLATHQRMQSMNRPYRVLVFNKPVEISESKGFAMVTDSLKNLPDVEIVFDPFAGMGLTAKAVRKAGKIYIGSELNNARFQKLLANNP